MQTLTRARVVSIATYQLIDEVGESFILSFLGAKLERLLYYAISIWVLLYFIEMAQGNKSPRPGINLWF